MTTAMDSFKKCNACGTTWKDRGAFLSAADVNYLGYQDFIEDGVLGLFLFNNTNCGTTLALEASRLHDLDDGSSPEVKRYAPEDPPPACLAAKNGRTCPSACECEFVHRMSLRLSGDWPVVD